MSFDLTVDQQYKAWLAKLKHKVRNAQIKAAVRVNTELLTLYWELGADIIAKQTNTKWGDGFLLQLSKDLMAEFPDLKGFSKRNLEIIRQWYLFYSQANHVAQPTFTLIAKQAVSQLTSGEDQPVITPQEKWITTQITQIPWGHNIAIITKCKNLEEALYYVQNTIHYNWSRAVLVHQIESKLYQREGKALNNFALTLPKPQSDLAQQTLKDPYIFDFLHLTKDYTERDLENGLIEHITKFLLELGAGFSFLGRQYHLEIGGQDFYIDLLFYHVKLHCYVVIELKATDFQPEYAGKLNFYLSAVDDRLRSDPDQPTIGILICKDKNKTVAEYALRDIHKPIGVSEYQLTQSLPDDLKSSLPSIEEIERELEGLPSTSSGSEAQPSPLPELVEGSGEGSEPAGEYAAFWAGTKIHAVGDPLWGMGLAMANMGDIDRQSLAGAISTGTHGTGPTLGSISTQVVGLRLVIASGEVIACSPTQEPEIFKAARCRWAHWASSPR